MTDTDRPASPEQLSLDDLRARRSELQQLDDAISYARRVAQGRLDLVRAEQDGRRPTRGDGVAHAGELRDVLADRLLGGSARPPRPVDDHSDHPVATDLDRLCADHGFGRFTELDDHGLGALSTALDDYEQRISARRREVYAELDALTDELVARLAPS